MLKSNNAHPNVAEYYGCGVKDGRIVGLCWRRYTNTLSERAESPSGKSVTLTVAGGNALQKGISRTRCLGCC